MNPSAAISADYNYGLVALSVLIAICASYVALDLAARVRAARNTARLAWLVGGAIAMGTGIWSMHYTGMLAYRLPMPVYYHIPTVFLSLVAAVFASFVAFFVISREKVGPLQILGGSLPMALGIVAMHYTGMDAMRLSAMHQYDMSLVAVSVVIALVVSCVALIVTFEFREDKPGMSTKILCSIAMGIAIPAMHYTAMAAVSYSSVSTLPDLTYATDISALADTAIVVLTFMLLGFVVLLRWWAPPTPVSEN
ncbi:MAG: MHYT domain-containing protein [Candidatus Sulfotelmatobacter sp.]